MKNPRLVCQSSHRASEGCPGKATRVTLRSTADFNVLRRPLKGGCLRYGDKFNSHLSKISQSMGTGEEYLTDCQLGDGQWQLILWLFLKHDWCTRFIEGFCHDGSPLPHQPFFDFFFGVSFREVPFLNLLYLVEISRITRKGPIHFWLCCG